VVRRHGDGLTALGALESVIHRHRGGVSPRRRVSVGWVLGGGVLGAIPEVPRVGVGAGSPRRRAREGDSQRCNSARRRCCTRYGKYRHERDADRVIRRHGCEIVACRMSDRNVVHKHVRNDVSAVGRKCEVLGRSAVDNDASAWGNGSVGTRRRRDGVGVQGCRDGQGVVLVHRYCTARADGRAVKQNLKASVAGEGRVRVVDHRPFLVGAARCGSSRCTRPDGYGQGVGGNGRDGDRSRGVGGIGQRVRYRHFVCECADRRVFVAGVLGDAMSTPIAKVPVVRVGRFSSEGRARERDCKRHCSRRGSSRGRDSEDGVDVDRPPAGGRLADVVGDGHRVRVGSGDSVRMRGILGGAMSGTIAIVPVIRVGKHSTVGGRSEIDGEGYRARFFRCGANGSRSWMDRDLLGGCDASAQTIHDLHCCRVGSGCRVGVGGVLVRGGFAVAKIPVETVGRFASRGVCREADVERSNSVCGRGGRSGSKVIIHGCRFRSADDPANDKDALFLGRHQVFHLLGDGRGDGDGHRVLSRGKSGRRLKDRRVFPRAVWLLVEEFDLDGSLLGYRLRVRGGVGERHILCRVEHGGLLLKRDAPRGRCCRGRFGDEGRFRADGLIPDCQGQGEVLAQSKGGEHRRIDENRPMIPSSIERERPCDNLLYHLIFRCDGELVGSAPCRVGINFDGEGARLDGRDVLGLEEHESLCLRKGRGGDHRCGKCPEDDRDYENGKFENVSAHVHFSFFSQRLMAKGRKHQQI